VLECSGPCRCRNPTRVVRLPTACRAAADQTRAFNTLRRTQVAARLPAKARERWSAKAVRGSCWIALEGQSPREHPAVIVLIARWPARDFCKGENPEAAACRAGPPRQRSEERQEKRHVGSSRRKRRRYLAEGEGSEGRIPRAPPVRDKTGTGSKGVSRREGDQTLRADRSGQVKPA